jgi:hypothetical protein
LVPTSSSYDQNILGAIAASYASTDWVIAL